MDLQTYLSLHREHEIAVRSNRRELLEHLKSRLSTLDQDDEYVRLFSLLCEIRLGDPAQVAEREKAAFAMHERSKAVKAFNDPIEDRRLRLLAGDALTDLGEEGERAFRRSVNELVNLGMVAIRLPEPLDVQATSKVVLSLASCLRIARLTLADVAWFREYEGLARFVLGCPPVLVVEAADRGELASFASICEHLTKGERDQIRAWAGL